jgi:hypothetical protein
MSASRIHPAICGLNSAAAIVRGPYKSLLVLLSFAWPCSESEILFSPTSLATSRFNFRIRFVQIINFFLSRFPLTGRAYLQALRDPQSAADAFIFVYPYAIHAVLLNLVRTFLSLAEIAH